MLRLWACFWWNFCYLLFAVFCFGLGSRFGVHELDSSQMKVNGKMCLRGTFSEHANTSEHWAPGIGLELVWCTSIERTVWAPELSVETVLLYRPVPSALHYFLRKHRLRHDIRPICYGVYFYVKKQVLSLKSNPWSLWKLLELLSGTWLWG